MLIYKNSTINKFIISPEKSVRDAMQKLDESAQKIIFVAGADLVLLGVITDGDIRRWILKNGELSSAVTCVMNRNPLTLMPGYDPVEVKKTMKQSLIECIPIVDGGGRILNAVWWSDFFVEKAEIVSRIELPVVIMAGGKGTRLDPFTKILPKPLIPIGNKPVIELIIEKYAASGCSKFFISVNYKANMIKAYFNEIEKNYEMTYLEEEKELGTAGSLALLKSHNIKTPFFVNNCDIIVSADYEDIYKYHRDSANFITVVGSLKNFKIPYGVIETNENGSMKAMKEKPEFNYLVNTGMYLIQPEALNDIPEREFFHITDLISRCRADGKRVGVYPISEKSWTDIGQMEELYSALKKFD
ncbi:MAG: Glucose-1-phosphate cytidylyltransferase [bacterium ADurb.Bin243]|nr:MAG: Glucose-1-phosphate cytidylyltransferase [bacterium ADurb.Bin243]